MHSSSPAPHETIHLDTARLGRLRPASLDALHAFGRLLAIHGRMPRYASVLREGFSALPRWVQDEFPTLSFWQGLEALQGMISQMTTGTASGLVIFSAQSTALMVFAAHVLARRARRILCTDLEFPLLQQAIRRTQESYGGSLEVLPIRHLIEEEGSDADQLTQLLIAAYLQRECQGLVLSQVTQEGIHMPCEAIMRRLRALDAGAFFMVDGAQGLELEPCRAITEQADLYFSVTHKWLEGATLGLVVAARPASQGLVKATLKELVERYVITDPYLRLIACVSGMTVEPMYETISLEQLFVSAVACQIAAARSPEEGRQRYDRLKAFTDDLEAVISTAGCRYRRRHRSLRSGIAVLDWPAAIAAGGPEAALEAAGVVVTGLSGTSVRVSAPTTELTDYHWRRLEQVFSSISGGRP
jgi:hypothetical protein